MQVGVRYKQRTPRRNVHVGRGFLKTGAIGVRPERVCNVQLMTLVKELKRDLLFEGPG